jgi:hypothetical protein
VVLDDGRRLQIGVGREAAIADLAREISRFPRLPVKLE